MFFAPPKVKSLSRYAEYGAYLGNKHFLVMLAIAMTAHLAVIGIYSMVPSQEIIRIPVRPLNIKLASGGSTAMHVSAPTAAPMASPPAEQRESEPEAEVMKPIREEAPESAIDKALTKDHARVTPRVPAHAPAVHESHHNAHDGVSETTITMPRKYVREGDSAPARGVKGHGGSGGGNGSEIAGDVSGNEVIERYTQTISQWIKNHQAEARERCAQARESTGECDAKGDVVVRIRIDRDGHILYNTVDKTSGKELVDQLAIQIVRASDPVPSVPSNFPENQLEFLVDVQVDLTARH